MPRTAIEEALKPRIEAIAAVLADVPDHYLWRFRGRDKHVRVALFDDGGTTINYRLADDKKALCALKLVRPRDGWVGDRKVTEIPTGPEKQVDKLVLPAENYDGIVQIPIEYDKRLTVLRTREKAFAVGFTQTIQQTFGIEAQAGGGETSGGSYVKVTASTMLGLESRQDTTNTEGEQHGEDAGAGISPDCPPGYDITFTLDRYSVPMKTRVTANTDVDFGFAAGKHWSGGWKGNKGKHGKYYSRHISYDSYWEEFVPVVKGEGRRDLSLALWFREHPVKGALLAAIEQPLDLPFDHTGDEFDGTTRLVVRQKVLRGPKHESQRMLVEDQLDG